MAELLSILFYFPKKIFIFIAVVVINDEKQKEAKSSSLFFINGLAKLFAIFFLLSNVTACPFLIYKCKLLFNEEEEGKFKDKQIIDFSIT